MNFIYNLFHILLLPLLVLILPIYLILKPSRRSSIISRLGFGLELNGRRKQKTIWIHALSVGEVTSAYPLVKKLHQEKRDTVNIVFSATTSSGREIAEHLIAPFCDSLTYFPIDFYPVVQYFLRKIQPDLFILIETDFWPNFLHSLSQAHIPMLLLNGRISTQSMKKYGRFSFFFRPLFDAFTLLCMQTASDAQNMKELGIINDKIRTLGNLKFSEFDAEPSVPGNAPGPFQQDSLLIFGGSTHDGEEEILTDIFCRLRANQSKIHLVIAPRNIVRCDDIVPILARKGLTYRRYSSAEADTTDVTIIDTIGDLAHLYRYAAISFIGGSLVPEGGHNPLEAARHGCPVLFGPCVDDFSEICSELLAAQGALEVKDPESLYTELLRLLSNASDRRVIGENARRYAASYHNVLTDHIHVIDQYL